MNGLGIKEEGEQVGNSHKRGQGGNGLRKEATPRFRTSAGLLLRMRQAGVRMCTDSRTLRVTGFERGHRGEGVFHRSEHEARGGGEVTAWGDCQGPWETSLRTEYRAHAVQDACEQEMGLPGRDSKEEMDRVP